MKTKQPGARLIVVVVMALASLVAWQVAAPGFAREIFSSESDLTRYLFIKGVFAVWIVLLVVGAGLFRASGFHPPMRLGAIWTGAPMLALAALLMASLATTGLQLTGLQIAGWIAVAVSVAIGEETIFRGLLHKLVSPLGVWATAILTSLGFGSAHLLGLLGDTAPSVILAQCFFASCVGLVLAAVRLAAGSIWTVIILHVVFNSAAFVSAGGVSSIVSSEGDAIQRFLIGGSIMLVWGLAAVFLIARQRKARR